MEESIAPVEAPRGPEPRIAVVEIHSWRRGPVEQGPVSTAKLAEGATPTEASRNTETTIDKTRPATRPPGPTPLVPREVRPTPPLSTDRELQTPRLGVLASNVDGSTGVRLVARRDRDKAALTRRYAPLAA